MLGCDLHCGYCQNWDISQALRDSTAGRSPALITPSRLVDSDSEQHTRVFASSYNEPLITSEWAVEIFKEANAPAFYAPMFPTAMPREVLEYIKPYVQRLQD